MEMKILKDENVNLQASYIGLILTFVFALCFIYFCCNLYTVTENVYRGGTEYNFSFLNICGAVAMFIFTLIFLFNSYIIVSPNEKVVVSFLGKYRGTISNEGISIVNPFFSFDNVSTKIKTFETKEAKINDKEGIPLNVSMVVNYQVLMAAPYHYNVENPKEFIINGSESELRKIVTHHVFDSDEEDQETLSKNLDSFSEQLVKNINEKMEKIGVRIISANISKMSYAQEISGAMLQRQQAKKVGESRKEIVKAAVFTVRDAIVDLEKETNVKFNDDEKKDMLKKLMLVIVSDKATTPVINLD
jgi:hypothetical protein